MKRLVRVVREAFPAVIEGQVHRVLGLTAESRGLFAPVGGCCDIHCWNGQVIRAEVVGFRQAHAIVAPFGDIWGISAGDRIVYRGARASVRVGSGLIGHVIDCEGKPIDGGTPLTRGVDVPLQRAPTNPLLRRRVDRILVTGVRAIDAPALRAAATLKNSRSSTRTSFAAGKCAVTKSPVLSGQE